MKTLAKATFTAGMAILLLAVFGIEGGGFTLFQGAAIGIVGAGMALETMPATGWFE